MITYFLLRHDQQMFNECEYVNRSRSEELAMKWQDVASHAKGHAVWFRVMQSWYYCQNNKAYNTLPGLDIVNFVLLRVGESYLI